MSIKRFTFATFIKLAIASLVVGWLLSVLGITPQDLLTKLSGLGLGPWAGASDFAGWAGAYVLLGALVVLPVWLGFYLWGRFRSN